MTHTVLNQPPPLEHYDLVAAEPGLMDALQRGGVSEVDPIVEFGRKMASAEVFEWGFQANQHPPVLRTHDRFGNRIDQVEFHPAWHRLLDHAVANGLHSLPWQPGVKAGHLSRTAMTFLASQIEAGHFCPISMTYAVMPLIRDATEVAAEWTSKILSRTYDPRFAAVRDKSGVLLGMGMTEKQGGSDVRAITTRAVTDGADYVVTGHKWFTSAPMNDAFLILAQAPTGLTCFFLPRFRPDDSVNDIRILRLKDKLGNRSNASAEVEFEDAHAVRIGDEGRGVATIIEMVNGTRLDCVTGSAALMRQALSQAIHHCQYRRAFGAVLIDQPLMLNVLADLEVETEGAVLLMTRLASSFDLAVEDEHERSLRRITTPLAKYWVTKRCTAVVHEALECLGGNGYVEESILPRLLRESPLNAIWEGSGNVIALDVLRSIREPGTLEALGDEMSLARGHDPSLDSAIDEALTAIKDPDQSIGTRMAVEQLAIAWQGSLLARFGREEVYAAFARTRLGREGGRLFGTLPAGVNLKEIVEPAIPRLPA
ncbi:MAG TPA: acyl-CoA dehydrogenase family protein [Acidimicrobiia bacterium]